jgi:hypothetical protein
MPGNRGMSPRWRVGRSLGRTLYLDDKVIGMVDTPELAARIVEAMNAVDDIYRLVNGGKGLVAADLEQVARYLARRGTR